MNDIGTITSSASYINSSFSAYKTAQASLVVKSDNFGTPKTDDKNTNDDINDTATLSEEAMQLYGQDKEQTKQVIVTTITKGDPKTGTITKTTEAGTTTTDTTEVKTTTASTTDTTKSQDDTTETKNTDIELTKEQQQEVSQLKARDTEVKSHEQAHLSAAAGISASAPSYDYQTGPDGVQYAVGGEVSISFVSSQDPEVNIKNAQTMKASALAPADPSGQDRSVAQSADAIIAENQQKIREQKKEKTDSDNQTPSDGTTNSTETTGTTATETNVGLSLIS